MRISGILGRYIRHWRYMKHSIHIIIALFFLLLSRGAFAQNSSEQVPAQEYEVLIPNPIEDRATIKVIQGKHILTEIRMYDIIGKEVVKVKITSGNGSYPVNLSSLRPGMYFCTIFSDKGVVETRKLLKSN